MTADEWIRFGTAVVILCGIFGLLGVLGDRPTKCDRGWHRW